VACGWLFKHLTFVKGYLFFCQEMEIVMGLTHKFFFSLKSTRCTENKDEGYIGGEKEERE